MNFTALQKNLENNSFTASVFEKGDDAVSYLKNKLHGRKIGFGGSKTVEDIGLYTALSEDNACMFHWKGDRSRTLAEARTADTYITSVNAISEKGEIVNIDGTCNRIASTLYGPQSLFFIVGRNKVTKDLSSAIDRARNIAAPQNAKRLGRRTPCAVGGRCFDCSSPERICSAMTVHFRRPGGIPYCEVILINEDLGL